jgi:hypothetical protein
MLDSTLKRLEKAANQLDGGDCPTCGGFGPTIVVLGKASNIADERRHCTGCGRPANIIFVTCAGSESGASILSTP